MNSVLDWLDDPLPGHGIHYYRPDSGWLMREYREIAESARRMAAFLRDSGLRQGVVSLIIEDPETFIPAFLGTMYAGLAPSPIASPVSFTKHDAYTDHAGSILAAAAPAAVLTDAAMQPLAEEACKKAGVAAPLVLPATIDAEPLRARHTAELALLQFTSGSSGTPKGVRVTPDNLAANVAAIRGWLGLTPEDSCSSWLPLYHDMGLIGSFLCSVVTQMDLWLMLPVDFIRAPVRWLECHGTHGVRVTTAPNFGYAYAASRVREEDLSGFDFSSWRVAMSGAERVDPRVAADFTRRMSPYGFTATTFAPCYGMAETTLAVTGASPGKGARIVRPGGALVPGEPVRVEDQGTLGVDRPDDAPRWIASCGGPIPQTTVEIVDEDGNALPAGAYGEIRVSGASVALGYQSPDPEASAPFTERGLHTGDAGFLFDGELYVVGRIGDSLKVRGRKVHAEDLEAALVEVPGVPVGRLAVALGTWEGQGRAVAVVETKDDTWVQATATLLRSALDDGAAVTIMRARRGAIPRTSSGKPRRRLMWRQVCQGELPGDVLHDTFDTPGAAAGPGIPTPATAGAATATRTQEAS
jgi:acyl-CoA synthetase (AMP-forming)/AMP-acid ligase II